jgi:hypothetical protein
MPMKVRANPILPWDEIVDKPRNKCYSALEVRPCKGLQASTSTRDKVVYIDCRIHVVKLVSYACVR